VLDPGSTPTMSTPCSVAQDSVPAKHRRDELGDRAVGAVGENATMLLAERLDVRAAVVHWIVAVTWTARGGGGDPQIASASADQDLRVTRPAVVLGPGQPVDGHGSGSAYRRAPTIRVGPWGGSECRARRAVVSSSRRSDALRTSRSRSSRRARGSRVGSQRGTGDQDALRERA
jgi:hypothetical protein